ncbi:MAG TPA: hypothetical protein VHM90_03240, partial [Phycisphaerae bacterium]|nr:hypothetical protein [Phycisphaerae bacterium]
NLVLDGGLALSDANGRILLEPQCCSDLHNHRDWRSATQCQNPDWQMLWIGHPWISVRQESARLLLSDLHESDAPVAKWIVEPLELECALDVAVAELHRFAKSLAEALLLLGVTDKADVMAESLAGLD